MDKNETEPSTDYNKISQEASLTMPIDNSENQVLLPAAAPLRNDGYDLKPLGHRIWGRKVII